MAKGISASELQKLLENQGSPVASAVEMVRDAAKERHDILYMTARAFAINTKEGFQLYPSEEEARQAMAEALATGEDLLISSSAGPSPLIEIPLYLDFKGGRLHGVSPIVELEELLDFMEDLLEAGEPICFIWREDLRELRTRLETGDSIDLWAISDFRTEDASQEERNIASHKILHSYLLLLTFLKESEERGEIHS